MLSPRVPTVHRNRESTAPGVAIPMTRKLPLPVLTLTRMMTCNYWWMTCRLDLDSRWTYPCQSVREAFHNHHRMKSAERGEVPFLRYRWCTLRYPKDNEHRIWHRREKLSDGYWRQNENRMAWPHEWSPLITGWLLEKKQIKGEVFVRRKWALAGFFLPSLSLCCRASATVNKPM